MIKKLILSGAALMLALLPMNAQNIQEYNHNVSWGTATSYNNPGKIVYPTGYDNSSNKTPVIFVHGITASLESSYAANIAQVQNYNLKAAFVQLEPLGSTTDNGLLLKRMIDKVLVHFNTETVSIVAHSKGGMDTERALYYRDPDNWSNPSFAYENVDAVYTLSSPLKGARVADVGATLSWFSGVTWALMWYTNGYSLTSGSTNSFHNWANGWVVNSNGSFKNYYNPSGAAYYRNHFSEDNTTRWWAHQSNDECYDNLWYYCYVGRPFHHSVGAYIDAYWEWDWFNSGWRNWHSDSDGFISEYRAKREGTNAYPGLTPDAGDSNWRTMQDANHSSLWSAGENHFSNEVAPYLHYGLFNTLAAPNEAPLVKPEILKDPVSAPQSQIMASNGNMYRGIGGDAQIIIEESDKTMDFIIYSENPVEHFSLTNNASGDTYQIETSDSQKEDLSGAFVSAATVERMQSGQYTVSIGQEDFLVIGNCDESSTAFAVNLNFDEGEGYHGQSMEVGIANADDRIDFDQVEVTATLTLIATDSDEAILMDRTKSMEYTFVPTDREGIYRMAFPDLIPGGVYSLRIEAVAHSGDVLLSRNIATTFYATQALEVQYIDLDEEGGILFEDTDAKENHSQVYPNPTTGEFTIVNDREEIAAVYIVDGMGMVIKTIPVADKKVVLNALELGLEKGMYVLKIQSNSGINIQQLLIE